jgi:hypothetical protein
MTTPHPHPSPTAPGYPQGYGYGAPQGYGGYGYGGPVGPPPSNGLAVAALILGIVGLLGGIVPILGWFASPFALAAVGLGFAGLSRAKTVQRGRGLAIGGLVTGALGLVAITAWTVLLLVGTKQTADLYSGEALFGCDATRDSYEDNVEEFRETEGREPQSEDELIDEGYRTWASGDFDVVVVDGRAEVVEQEGGTC